eukprot:gene29192-36202_t
MQLNYGRDLEARLEQTLTRWKEERENLDKEILKTSRLNKTCSDLITKCDKLALDLKRCDDRLVMYDDLPVPTYNKI